MILISPYVIVWPWLWAGSTHNSPSIAATSSTAQSLSLSCQGFLFWCCEVDSISNSLKEFVNPDMVPFVLPSALYIAQEVSFILVYKYTKCIAILWRPAKQTMWSMFFQVSNQWWRWWSRSKSCSYSCRLPTYISFCIQNHFDQKMDLLLEKTPPEDVRSDVLPMVYRALESGVSQIQELCLSIIPSFAGSERDYGSNSFSTAVWEFKIIVIFYMLPGEDKGNSWDICFRRSFHLLMSNVQHYTF